MLPVQAFFCCRPAESGLLPHLPESHVHKPADFLHTSTRLQFYQTVTDTPLSRIAMPHKAAGVSRFAVSAPEYRRRLQTASHILHKYLTNRRCGQKSGIQMIFIFHNQPIQFRFALFSRYAYQRFIGCRERAGCNFLYLLLCHRAYYHKYGCTYYQPTYY